MAADASPSQLSLTHILQSNIDDLRNLVACRICIRPMYEPYTTQCGHTFCYSCLRQWFDRDHSKKTCPDCRAHVVHQPAPAYLVSRKQSTAPSAASLAKISLRSERLHNPSSTQLHSYRRERILKIIGNSNGTRQRLLKGIGQIKAPMVDSSTAVSNLFSDNVHRSVMLQMA